MGGLRRVFPGQRYGRLLVLEGTRKEHWRATVKQLCQCDCGNYVYVLRQSLAEKRTISCGCARIDSNASRITHGMSKTSTYTRWGSMIDRCIKPQNKRYKDYGGRGIAVCERWMTFELFLEDMGEAPDGLCLDRIDNNGPYCKENCRWTTYIVNNNNRRERSCLDRSV